MVDINHLLRAANEMAPLPASCVRLARLVNDPDSGTDALAEVVALDQALTVRLLRMANSAYSASETRVTDVSEALLRLGSAQVLAFAISMHARAMMQNPIQAYGLGEHELWKHSVRTALAVELIPSVLKRSVPPATFAAALLHDVGKLLMDRFLSEEEMDALRRGRETGDLNLLQVEAQVMQVNHAELGGVIARHWNLPDPIVHGIIHHHEPERVKEEVPDLVYVANLAAKCADKSAAHEPVGLSIEKGVVDRTQIDAAGVDALANAVAERFDEVFQHYEAGD